MHNDTPSLAIIDDYRVDWPVNLKHWLEVGRASYMYQDCRGRSQLASPGGSWKLRCCRDCWGASVRKGSMIGSSATERPADWSWAGLRARVDKQVISTSMAETREPLTAPMLTSI